MLCTQKTGTKSVAEKGERIPTESLKMAQNFFIYISLPTKHVVIWPLESLLWAEALSPEAYT